MLSSRTLNEPLTKRNGMRKDLENLDATTSDEDYKFNLVNPVDWDIGFLKCWNKTMDKNLVIYENKRLAPASYNMAYLAHIFSAHSNLSSALC